MSFVDALKNVVENEKIQSEIAIAIKTHHWEEDTLIHSVFYYLQAFSTANRRINEAIRTTEETAYRHLLPVKTKNGGSINLSAAIIAAKAQKSTIMFEVIGANYKRTIMIFGCKKGKTRDFLLKNYLPSYGFNKFRYDNNEIIVATQ